MKQRFSKRTRLVSALLTLAMVCTFLPFSAFAEVQTYIPLYKFPDETFREYLEQFDKDDDTFLDTAEREAVKEINVANKNISNLYGIQFFPNLEKLDCDQNDLSSLDVSQNPALKYLYCEQNNLSSLDVSSNSALKYLHCTQNNLSSLDVSQNPALEYLLCAQNKLTSLDVSKNGALKLLNCKNNQLTNLNVEYTNIDPSVFLSELLAQDNTYPITVGSDRTFNLSTLPGKFEVSKADNWNGGSVNGNTLTVNKGETQVTYTYDCGKGLSETFTLNVTVGIRIFGDNFPNYEFRQYLKANIDKDGDGYLNDTELNIRKLDVSGQHIANLKGIEFFPNLEILYCYNNKLTSLDVSQNPALQYLYCSNNNLTSLDVSKNTNLTELECNENQLTELDVRQNAALTYLSCSKNNLTSLDVSKNTNLIELECNENQLTSLDVSKNTVLEYLWCSQNNLTSLDVSKNTALKKLYFSKNQLTKLDVRQNAALTKLVCDQNQLTELDVSQNAALVDLYCYQNQLTELDVSKNTALDWLKCYQNQLTSLDVSQNKALELLYCQQNYLTSLDVSKNTQLRALRCSQNNLTSLNVENTKVDLPAIYLPEFEAENNTYLIAVGSDRTFDLSNLPGFDVTKASGWVGGTVDGGTLKVDESATQVTYTYDCGKGFSKTFTLNVNVVPDGTVTPPSGGGTGTTTPPSGGGTGTTTPPSGGDGTGTTTPPSGGDGTGTTTPPSGGDGGGGAVIIMAAGAAAAGVVGYGVYNYVSGRKLQALLPEGVAAPENRAQTALLLWNTAGRPEPAEAPAFADVADPDTAKAAQWCMEQGLMKRRLNGKFAPGSSIPAYQVLNAYRKLAG